MATTSAIGKMTSDAQARLAVAMERLSAALGVPPLAVMALRYRDPAYEAAARWAALAEWAEQLADRVDGIAPAHPAHERLAVLRLVLQRELSAKTKAELEQFARDYGVALNSSLKKDEMVTALAEQLTGQRLEIVPASEQPDGLETVTVLEQAPLPDLAPGQVVRLSAIED
jgi:hypothetical protein